MTNIEKVRNFVLKQFQAQMDVPFRNDGIEHTLHVVSYASMLAKQRNINTEEAVIASYLHDLATYTSHYSDNHALRSSKQAKTLLPTLTTLQESSISNIVEAIKNHSTKNEIHDALSELLKDADVLAHYYSGTILNENEKTRLEKI